MSKRKQDIGPSGYMVVLRHTMDDLPLAFFNNEAEALFFAGSVDKQPSKTIRDIYDVDCTTPVCVCVYEFKNGLPCRKIGSIGYCG